jgi:hypothetical protein
MVICNLHLFRAKRRPPEAQPILIVDPDRMLSRAVSFKRLKPIGRWYPQVVEPGGIVKHQELAARSFRYLRVEFSCSLAAKDCFGGPTPETPDHCA